MDIKGFSTFFLLHIVPLTFKVYIMTKIEDESSLWGIILTLPVMLHSSSLNIRNHQNERLMNFA